MSVIKLEAVAADPDGRLRLDLPARPGWRYNVQVIVSLADPIPADATPEERGEWPPEYLEMIFNGFGPDHGDDSHWEQFMHRDQDRPDAADAR